MRVFFEDKDGGAFDDVDAANLIDAGAVKAMVAVLASSSTEEFLVVCLRSDLPSGQTALSTVELSILLDACDMFVAKHGDPRIFETAARAKDVH
ncbi:MAG: hypothetical protein V3W41_21935 [Planctomycetota bacterium]